MQKMDDLPCPFPSLALRCRISYLHAGAGEVLSQQIYPPPFPLPPSSLLSRDGDTGAVRAAAWQGHKLAPFGVGACGQRPSDLTHASSAALAALP